jgi:hypothetical protein
MINCWYKPFRRVGGENDKVDLFVLRAFVLDFARAKIWISDFYEWAGLVIGVQFDLARAL